MMKYITLAFFMSFCVLSQHARAQERINLSIGMGFTDWYNVAVKYQLSQAQLGVSYGTNFFPNKANKPLMVLSISGYKHLFGQSKFSERKPWFLRGGVSYLRWNNVFQRRDLYANIYFGRDINVSQRVGIGISAGPVVHAYAANDYEGSIDRWILLPGLDVSVFYRLAYPRH